ncbi:unnamed protein product, partial [Effrenium voratum]
QSPTCWVMPDEREKHNLSYPSDIWKEPAKSSDTVKLVLVFEINEATMDAISVLIRVLRVTVQNFESVEKCLGLRAGVPPKPKGPEAILGQDDGDGLQRPANSKRQRIGNVSEERTDASSGNDSITKYIAVSGFMADTIRNRMEMCQVPVKKADFQDNAQGIGAPVRITGIPLYNSPVAALTHFRFLKKAAAKSPVRGMAAWRDGDQSQDAAVTTAAAPAESGMDPFTVAASISAISASLVAVKRSTKALLGCGALSAESAPFGHWQLRHDLPVLTAASAAEIIIKDKVELSFDWELVNGLDTLRGYMDDENRQMREQSFPVRPTAMSLFLSREMPDAIIAAD